MPSSRREQARNDQQEIVDRSPELARFRTEIKVVEVEQNFVNMVEDNGSSSGVSDSGSGDGYDVEYEAEATRDGREVYSNTYDVENYPYLTLAEDVYVDGGNLFAGSSQRGDGPGDNENLLSLSENGFGVSQLRDEEPDPSIALLDIEHSAEMPTTEEFALDGDEVLVFQAYSFNQHEGARETGDEFGGKGIEIEYTVLSGTGTVELVLINSEKDDVEELAEAISANLSNGQEGSLGAQVENGTYDFAVISVTGDLQIAVVGIEATSNVEFFEA